MYKDLTLHPGGESNPGTSALNVGALTTRRGRLAGYWVGICLSL
jgi:hypothetical protein